MSPVDRHSRSGIVSELSHAEENSKAIELLDMAIQRLLAITGEDVLMEETPLEVQSVINHTLSDMHAVLHTMKSVSSVRLATKKNPGGPTHQQGQFLAFIREYMMRNVAGVAPTHANLQRFFDLPPPSVNSMLVRLEQRGFIRRVPGVARAIELTIDEEQIPPLEKLFKLF
jgi:hypothetical protein